MQLGFGSGHLFITQLTDNAGTAIVNPTPQRFGVLQSGTLDIAGGLKELHGQEQFPVAIGREKGKITLSAKAARIVAELYNAFFFGIPAGVGTTRDELAVDESGTITTGAVTVANSGTFVADLGVFYSTTGLPFKRVASAPAVGQYSVAAGVYTFNTGENGVVVKISYRYTKTGKKIAFSNVLMGYVPFFSADLYVPYKGKSLVVHLYACVSDKLNLGPKNDDFLIPDFSASCFADDASNKVLDINTDE